MTGSIVLGDYLKSASSVYVDLPTLIETRLLIQANSGGGKSYAIRRFLEQTHGKVQQIVLDPEGEFGSLREKHDYILIGKGGDLQTSLKIAAHLPKKLMECGISAIIDLSELQKQDRKRFVRLFLEALIDLPRDLWGSLIVVLDEAHVFAPEKGECESFSSVADLASRGRKRGFCLVLATQRLSKLHKDVAAECGNKLIGRTGLDIDMKRAADELGFTSNDQRLSLRSLSPGSFYAFGPAICPSVEKLVIGKAYTTHPRPGQRLSIKTPAPSSKVRDTLKSLADLPKEIEVEVQNLDNLRKKVRELEAKLAQNAYKIDETVLQEARIRGILDGFSQAKSAFEPVIKGLESILFQAKNLEQTVKTEVNQQELNFTKKQPKMAENKRFLTDVSSLYPKNIQRSAQEFDPSRFGKAEKLILAFLSFYPGKVFTKAQVGVMTGYSYTSGTFNTYLSKLSTLGLIVRSKDAVHLPIERHGDVIEIVLDEDTSVFKLESWLDRLGKGPKAIYEEILANPSREYTKEDLASRTGFAISGTFNTYLSHLSTLGLISRDGGKIYLHPDVNALRSS